MFPTPNSFNQLWRKCLFLPPFSLPCYSFYLLTLTSQPSNHGSAFPNINLTRAFSCFYISPCSFFSSCSFIPSSRAYWYKPCGFRPERYWWLGYVSNTGQAFWKESCWGGNLNVLRNELWCLSCVRTHHCVQLFNWKNVFCKDTLVSCFISFFLRLGEKSQVGINLPFRWFFS